ncbi:CIC11C00000005653 [Sungouiella intermedia]|uniref:CIC11C00000000135 n=1 Tax=Sungouiella intermedia TaxID=45354 RepID=A0A1L0B952_9ASCO|nr:CIC11C00000005653 [[Candida] intermedia]SGZ50204.1 CIC11C00000000135 [[Candida] intermedia]
MSAIINKATGFVNSAVAKSTQLANCAVYWGKVGAEVVKVVYKAEGLAPPSQAQFQKTYQSWFNVLKTPTEQKALLKKLSSVEANKATAAKVAIYGVQALAFFSVGEVIGRRSLFGYPSVGHAEHH